MNRFEQLPKVLQNKILEYNADHRPKWKDVMQNIILYTHKEKYKDVMEQLTEQIEICEELRSFDTHYSYDWPIGYFNFV